MGLISRLFSAAWILLFSFQFAFTFGLPQLSTIGLDPIQQETCPTTNEELVSTLNGQLRCCKKCPAGEGMLQLCTNTTQTVCRPCQEGSEFALEASATAKCMQCKQCQELHPFAKFRKHCTPTSDAVCECVAGYFFIEARSTCQSCTKCPPGYGAEKPCDWNEDSICSPCPKGTWSSTESATQKCLTCKKCKPGQIEMRPCTATQNTLCCPLHNPNCDENYEEDEFDDSKSLPGVGHLPENSFPPQFTYGDDYPMITIYCSLLGLVILTLLIYVFYKLWQQKLSIEDAKNIEAGIFHPAFTGIKTSGGKSKSSKLAVSAKDTNDRQHLLGESQQYSYDPQKSAIPDQLLMELSQGLAVDNRWKNVGTKLGFNEESLQNFEKPKISEDSGDVISVVKHMLTSWYSSRIYIDPSPLNSLLVVLESAPETNKLARHLKEYLKSSCAINSSTNSSPISNNQ
nr:tumor necrosis factor receptor superfamily member [Hymenolepis microstoma]